MSAVLPFDLNDAAEAFEDLTYNVDKLLKLGCRQNVCSKRGTPKSLLSVNHRSLWQDI